MVTLIISIIFWCIPKEKGLGITAIILSILGTIGDMICVGWLCIIDIIILIINILIYTSKENKE